MLQCCFKYVKYFRNIFAFAPARGNYTCGYFFNLSIATYKNLCYNRDWRVKNA